MTATPNFASDALAGIGAGDTPAPAASTGPFVLNLCSSTTPMALAQTDLPELKRFTFFVSRRFEEGRERFRLHMGYFATLAEAEEWLSVVREIYPGAWAGEAPGKKLRERAAAAAAAQAQHAAGPQEPVSAPAPVRAPVAKVAAIAAPPVAMEVPVLQAAPEVPWPVLTPEPAPVAAKAAPAKPVPVAPAVVAAVAKPTPALARKPAPVAAPAAAVAASAPAARAAPAKPAPLAAPAAKTAPVIKAAPVEPVKESAALPVAAAKPQQSNVFGDSNVREVLQALGDASATGETRQMRAPPPPREAPTPKGPLSDTQVLKMLEVRVPAGASQPAQDPSNGSIPLLKPDDTGTREALKDAVTSNAAVLFAVQLQWSVQAVELEKVPPLAIFSAYTLYTVEGSRDGRKWYGLRLGFFSDANSAKQVAHYVRSEFAAVAVVPVSAQEKSRATDQDKLAQTVGSGLSARKEVDEFKLIDDSAALAEAAAAASAAARAAAPRPPASVPEAALKPLVDGAGRKLPGRPIPKTAVGRTVAHSAAAPAGKGRPSRGGAKVGARENRGAQSLEETLEILGAGQLAIDNGNGETLNESGVRHLHVEVQKNSPFARLLERLSDRVRKQ